MSNSSLVDVKIPANSNNYAIGRNGKKIEMITIHHMAGVLTAEECGSIFQNKNRIASSHYGIGKDGRIGQYVDEENTAYKAKNTIMAISLYFFFVTCCSIPNNVVIIHM